ncbi:MAG: hypothetical protein H6868_04225 [Rhodospirillales bacterium]|nr:hypothetical protein [Rhodospirillales bacterium]
MARIAVLTLGLLCLLGSQPAKALPGGIGVALVDAGHYNHVLHLLKENYIKALMRMTEQFTAVMMHQTLAVGMFFDAKHQLETERLFQQLVAEAHKDYHSDIQMCRFGTNMRSLAASERRSETNAFILNRALEDREFMTRNSVGMAGEALDLNMRLEKFKTTYCDIKDDHEQLDLLCGGSSGPEERVNKDVDFTRTLDNTYTLKFDLTDAAVTPDEEDIMALSYNLFSHRGFDPFARELLKKEETKDELMDTRSVHAIRSVARNSFAHQVGMRAEGDPEVKDFIKKIMEELGVPLAQIDPILGENPSYYAQMEMLTKKMYQNPNFYTNLYTTPANVKRIGASIKALKMMQDRDRFESSLRREMMISLMLELKLRELQQDVNNEMFRGLARDIADD